MRYLYLITIIIYLYISIVTPVMAAQSGAKTEVKANIPSKTTLRIFGYTSANSLVQALGVKVFAQTSSARDGYFLFNDLPISFQTKELCMATIDAERRVGFPLCISIPDNERPREIGPLLLSPTLSLSTASIWQNQNSAASGRTIPEQTVAISFFEVPASTLAQFIENKLARIFHGNVLAADLPVWTTKSDKNGVFSFTLPTSKASGFRVFVKAIYNNTPTPKSQTLSFLIGALTGYFLLYILPWILLILLILALIFALSYYEMKTKRGRALILLLIEKKLKPTAVRIHLKLRLLSYNLHDWWRSHRK